MTSRLFPAYEDSLYVSTDGSTLPGATAGVFVDEGATTLAQVYLSPTGDPVSTITLDDYSYIPYFYGPAGASSTPGPSVLYVRVGSGTVKKVKSVELSSGGGGSGAVIEDYSITNLQLANGAVDDRVVSGVSISKITGLSQELSDRPLLNQVVTLLGSQTVSGRKNFVGGLYSAGNLVLTTADGINLAQVGGLTEILEAKANKADVPSLSDPATIEGLWNFVGGLHSGGSPVVTQAMEIPIAKVTNLTTALESKANNNQVVHLAGDESITGHKTFNGPVTFNDTVNLQVTSDMIVDGTIQSVDLKDGSVTGGITDPENGQVSKIAKNTVRGGTLGNLAHQTITDWNIADVNPIKLTDGTITANITVDEDGKIATAGSGPRVQLDASGIKVYDANGVVGVLGSDGTIDITGTIHAKGGSFDGDITSTAIISGGTLRGGIIETGSGESSVVRMDSTGLRAYDSSGVQKVSISTNGQLTASGADISGTISATSGVIGGWTIEPTKLSGSGVIEGGTVQGTSINGATMTGGVVQTGTSGSRVYMDEAGLHASDGVQDKLFYNIATGQLTIQGGGTFSGHLQAATGTFSGELQAASGTFSGVVTADAFIIGQDTNIISDGSFEHLNTRAYLNEMNPYSYAWTFVQGPDPVAAHGNWALNVNGTVNPGTLREFWVCGKVAVQPGDTYYTEFHFRPVTTVNPPNGVISLVAVWYDRLGNSTESPVSTSWNQEGWWYYTHRWEVPSTATHVRFKYVLTPEGNTGAWSFDRLQIRRSVPAGQLTTGSLHASTVITVGELDQTHLVIGNSSLQVWRPDGDGVPQITVSVGGNDRDVLLITDPETGSTTAGFDGEGNGIAQSMNVTSSMYIGGNQIGDPYDRNDLLFSPARGAIARYMISDDSGETSTAQLGIAEVTAQCWSPRLYRATFEGNILNTDPGGSHRLFLRGEVGGGTPTLTSPQWTMGFFPNNPIGGGHMRDTISTYFFVGGAVDAPVTVRVLVSMQRIGGTGNIKFHRDGGLTPGYLIIEDLGPLPGFASEVWSDGRMSNGSGTPVSGNNPGTPSTGKTNYTKTYNATWSRTWRGGTVQSSGEIRQGYSSGQLQSAIGFPSQVQSDVSGGKITKIEVYLYANHWYYNNGGTAVIGAHGANSLPASFPSGSATTTATWKSKAGGMWVTLPSSWYLYWESGSSKGITVGNAPPATSSNTYYARFNGYGMSYAPKLRITYTK